VDPAAGRPTTLYRFYNDAGELLYVGITHRPQERFSHHRAFSSWWEVAATSRLERFPTRAEAENAERRAILTEVPVHNVAGTSSPARQEPRAVVPGAALGLAEIAEVLGVSVNVVRMWKHRGKLPAPTHTLKAGQFWQGREIEAWLSRTNRTNKEA
jgi:hypothetical protein